jgi:hypothetical protein
MKLVLAAVALAAMTACGRGDQQAADSSRVDSAAQLQPAPVDTSVAPSQQAEKAYQDSVKAAKDSAKRQPKNKKH